MQRPSSKSLIYICCFCWYATCTYLLCCLLRIAGKTDYEEENVIMRKFRNLMVFALIVVPVLSFANNIPAASCSVAHLNAAIAVAVDGDTVVVPSGNCTWTKTSTTPLVTVSKSITISGSGPDKSTGTSIYIAPGTAYTSTPAILLSTTNSSAHITLSGFYFSGETSYDGMVKVGGSSKYMRITNNVFTDDGVGGTRQLLILDGSTKGVVDNNTFLGGQQAIKIHATQWKADGNGHESWQKDVPWGTNYTWYIENNTYDNPYSSGDASAAPRGAIDCFRGGQYVFRYNNVTDFFPLTHGGLTDSTIYPVRGCRSMEIYGNTFTMSSKIIYRPEATLIYGGAALIFNNTYNMNRRTERAISLTNQRDGAGRDASYPTYKSCDGTHPWDGNGSDQTGWLCRDQPGAGKDPVSPVWPVLNSGNPYPAQTREPVYVWGNIYNNRGYGASDVAGSTHVQLDRDYFLRAPQSGDIPYPYQPYTYPHPLTMTSTPKTPKSIQGISISP